MSDIAIDLQNIGKQYKIGSERQRYRALRDTLTDVMKTPVRRARQILRGQAYAASDLNETFWALRNVSLQIKEGEVVGIIGRNGAGKSTLLKILSRITEPSEGCADIYGRVGALLEVGTGFHPELTGRENVFFNGAVLGMRRHEIERKFDEIVAFAEVEKFIDTPVKHYSSGMALRLGFAVAAHLETEILLVDEVLAVGDVAFQKKTLGKMDEVARSGRTVLFVSHNMASVGNLCTHGILLHQGRLIDYGQIQEVIEHYLRVNREEDVRGGVFENARFVEGLSFANESNAKTRSFHLGDRIAIEIKLKNMDQLVNPNVGVLICNNYGSRLVFLAPHLQTTDLVIPRLSRTTLRVVTDPITLLPGQYTIELGVGSGFEIVERLYFAANFDIEATDYFGTGKLPHSRQGVAALRAQWEIAE